MKDSISGAIIGALAVGLVSVTGVAIYAFNIQQTPYPHYPQVAAHRSAASTALRITKHGVVPTIPTVAPSVAPANSAYAGIPSAYTNIPEVVLRASSGKLAVVHAFAGPYPNTTGVIAQLTNGQKGQMFLWVITPPSVAKPLLFSGSGYNYDGHNITKEYLLKNNLLSPAATTTSASPKTATMAQPAIGSTPPIDSMSKADILAHVWADPASFVIGTKGPEIAVFIDPNCIFCHSYLEQTLYPLTKGGKIRVKVIPVGFLHPSSAPKAWHLLAAGSSALAINEKNFNTTIESGALTGYTVAQSNTVKIPNTGLTVGQGVMANTILLKATDGNFATPTTVVKVNGVLQSFEGVKTQNDLLKLLGVK